MSSDVPDVTPKNGVGCFLVVVGIALAIVLVKWSEQGFPKFWQ